MEILVVILAVALVAVIAFTVMQRRGPGIGAGGLSRRGSSPLGRGPSRAAAHRDPMAAAVHEHAQTTDPQEVVAAEQRMRAQASQVASRLRADADRNPAPMPSADGLAEHATAPADPYQGELPPDYDDKRHDGRRAENWVDPRYDDRA